MPNRPKQFNLNFESGEGQSGEKKENKIEVHENDECPACGNAFEGAGSCFQCRSNKRKINWLKNRH